MRRERSGSASRRSGGATLLSVIAAAVSGQFVFAGCEASPESQTTSGSTQLAVEDTETARGDKIVFVRRANDLSQDADLFIVDRDASNQQPLTSGPEQDDKPAWAPDGRRIAFERYSEVEDEDGFLEGESDILVMNADGTNPRNLTGADGADEYAPVWSPDGRKIAFWRVGRPPGELSEVDGIYVMNADGTDQRNLTPRTPGDGLAPDFAADSNPAWSPDGTQIAFERGTEDQLDLFIMNSDGTNQRRLTQNLGTPYAEMRPVWSPDGSMIAFDAAPRSGISSVWVMNADGTAQRPIGRPGGAGASWAPDGERLAYTRWDEIHPERSSVDSVRLDGGGLRILTRGKSDAGYPAWSPDGKSIAFLSPTAGPDTELYIMDSDGFEPSNLSQSATGGESEHAWQPAFR